MLSPKDALLTQKVFLCILASAADAVAVNHNGSKTLLADGQSTFFIKGKPDFSNGLRILPRNHPDCTVLDSLAFDNFIL